MLVELCAELDGLVGLPQDAWRAPVPNAVDRELASIIQKYVALEDDQRSQFLHHVNRRHIWIFEVFAIHMATYSLKTSDEAPLRDGLVALSFELCTEADWRDILVALAVLNDACGRIGTELADVAASVRPLLHPDFLPLVDSFVRRNAASKSLKAFGYSVVTDDEGPRYHSEV
jgi:hypothetical protein